jgi:competence protein ComFC
MLRSYLEGFIDLIFPTTCFACQEFEPLHEHLLCINCLKNLPWIAEDAAIGALEGKESFPPGIAFFDSLLYFSKISKVQQLITAIKYNGQKELAQYLGKRLGEKLTDKLSNESFEIIPVPIHIKRRRERGYNQAEEIAKGIAPILGANINKELLIRNQYEVSQTQKDKQQRAARLEESFIINTLASAQKKNALLVDDVVTTGATINSCVQQLRQCGYKEVFVVTLAVSI